MPVKFEQNRMIQTKRNYELLEKKKKKKKTIFYNHFWQRGDAIWEDVTVAEIIVWC